MPRSNALSRLSLRLPTQIKYEIEEAAVRSGQSITEFAKFALSQAAQQVIRQQNVTRLSERDRQRFVEMLADETTKPKKSLIAAAKRYSKDIR